MALRKGNMECREKAGFMVVRIRFGRGSVVSRRKGKNGRLATLGASLLTMVSLSCASLGAWRLGADLGWTGDFVVESGFLSHWLVWIGFAAAMQYASWRLAGYAALTQEQQDAAEIDGESSPVPASGDTEDAPARMPV
jgi:hypothetical protein